MVNAATEFSPEYIEAAAELEYNMVFDDIPIEEKVIKFVVYREQETIDKMKLKVEKAREFLANLEVKHMNIYNQ